MTTEKTLSHSERPGTLDLDWVQGGIFPFFTPARGGTAGARVCYPDASPGPKERLGWSVFRRGSPWTSRMRRAE